MRLVISTALSINIAQKLAKHNMGSPGKLSHARVYVVAVEVRFHKVVYYSFESKKDAQKCMANGRFVRRIFLEVHWPSRTWIELGRAGWNVFADNTIRSALRRDLRAHR